MFSDTTTKAWSIQKIYIYVVYIILHINNNMLYITYMHLIEIKNFCTSEDSAKERKSPAMN
jgi:hypothetical protein